MRRAFTGAVLLAVLLCAAPSQAAFPGEDGKIAYTRFEEGQPTQIWSVNPDGTALTQLTEGLPSSFQPAWSPDGQKILFERYEDSFTRGIWVMNADGSGETRLGTGARPHWSPDGAKIVFYWDNALRVMDADGSGASPIAAGVQFNPAWSPDGNAIAVDGIRRFDADGSDPMQLTPAGEDPSWSPDATRIVFETGNDIWRVDRDGTAETAITTGGTPEHDPVVSPSGTRIAFQGNATASIVVMNADGSARTPIATQALNHPDAGLDWQPLPVNAYPRPKGATPVHLPLVPAYQACTEPDRTHGPPLSFGSCAAPQPASSDLTVGTADSNGAPTKSTGYVRYEVLVGNPGTPADEADVRLEAIVGDVRNAGTLTDYAGSLSAQVGLRITDKDNTPHPGGPGAGTTSDGAFAYAVPCAPTADTTVGSTCSVATTADAVVAGAVKEGDRAIWQLGPVELRDGADAPFMTQGVFIP